MLFEILHHSGQFEILCWWIIGSEQTMLLCPRNSSYVEVDKAVGLDFLDSMDGKLGSGSQEILGDLDSEMEELNL